MQSLILTLETNIDQCIRASVDEVVVQNPGLTVDVLVGSLSSHKQQKDFICHFGKKKEVFNFLLDAPKLNVK